MSTRAGEEPVGSEFALHGRSAACAGPAGGPPRARINPSQPEPVT